MDRRAPPGSSLRLLWSSSSCCCCCCTGGPTDPRDSASGGAMRVRRAAGGRRTLCETPARRADAAATAVASRDGRAPTPDEHTTGRFTLCPPPTSSSCSSREDLSSTPKMTSSSSSDSPVSDLISRSNNVVGQLFDAKSSCYANHDPNTIQGEVPVIWI